MAVDAWIWNRMARRYAAQPIADEASYQRKLALTQTHLRPDMALLEIGCGTGSTALAHAPHVASVLATDISDEMLAIGRNKAAAAGADNITFENVRLDEIATRQPGAFDAVLMLSVLHLMPGWQGALAQARQALKPGGLLVISVVCLGDRGALIRAMAGFFRATRVLPRIAAFSRAELDAELAALGMAEIEHFQPGPGRAHFYLLRAPG